MTMQRVGMVLPDDLTDFRARNQDVISNPDPSVMIRIVVHQTPVYVEKELQ